MTDLLDVGSRLPAWATPVGLGVAALALGVWTVLAAVPPTIDGSGSRAVPPPHAAYQPMLGRPLI